MLSSASPRVPSPRSTGQLRCELVPNRDVIAVEVIGEIDLASVDVLHGTLRDLRAAGFRRIHLDLQRVAFMDVRGLALLLQWSDLAAMEGLHLTIEPGFGAAWRVIALAGAADRLGCEPKRTRTRTPSILGGRG
jgi:anti-anti-sigma factor